MKSNLRLLAAFAVAPLATFPATLLVVTVAFLRMGGSPSSWSLLTRVESSVGVGAYVGLIALLYAYPITLVVGVPVTLALRKLGRFRVETMAVAGCVAGAVPFLPLFLGGLSLAVKNLMGGRRLEEMLPFGSMYLNAGLLSGFLTAYLIWLMASRPPAARTIGT
jgi:hypothetical protein